jgi:ABC-type Mn2+/Zn2+ transport system ATPase subunit
LLLKEQNLQILGSTKFNIRKFKKMLLDVSDGRSFPEKSYSLFNYETDLIDFNEKHYNEVKSLFESILDEETPYVLSKKTTKKIATQILLDDYFVDYWETTFDGDKMGEMSTGKASFVILMLIVGLSSSKAPILIDQPEDNLDNRSITKNLVKYLRNKKTERQIILVTHNPNIVVNADAENIIVAHQKGQNDKQTSSHYKFDYINGAIEESKEINIEEKDLLKSMGIREHIADVVEGGREAFQKREQKYGF